jgi:hypothetical protein
MKKKIAAILCLLMLSPISLALMPNAKAPDGNHYSWVEPAYRGYDPYYDEYIVGYKEGTYWNLTMSWTNEGMVPINISAVRLWFDWGKNYTQAFGSPIQVMPGVTQILNIYNMTPPIEEAPELWGPHTYDIWIENVNDTAQPYGDLSPIYFSSGSDFVALSQDHLDCLNYWAKYWMFIEGPMAQLPQLIPMTGLNTNISKVQVLLTQAILEFSQGYEIYLAGVFSQAKTHLETGDGYISEALTVWDDRGTAMEDASLAYTNAQASYYSGLGDASKINAYGWLLFGLGWVFIGLGVIIYGAKKSKTTPPPS